MSEDFGYDLRSDSGDGREPHGASHDLILSAAIWNFESQLLSGQTPDPEAHPLPRPAAAGRRTWPIT